MGDCLRWCVCKMYKQTLQTMHQARICHLAVYKLDICGLVWLENYSYPCLNTPSKGRPDKQGSIVWITYQMIVLVLCLNVLSVFISAYSWINSRTFQEPSCSVGTREILASLGWYFNLSELSGQLDCSVPNASIAKWFCVFSPTSIIWYRSRVSHREGKKAF